MTINDLETASMTAMQALAAGAGVLGFAVLVILTGMTVMGLGPTASKTYAFIGVPALVLAGIGIFLGAKPFSSEQERVHQANVQTVQQWVETEYGYAISEDLVTDVLKEHNFTPDAYPAEGPDGARMVSLNVQDDKLTLFVHATEAQKAEAL